MAEPQLAESVLNEERNNHNWWVSCLQCLRRPRQHQFRYIAHSFDRVLSSLAWKFLIFLSTIILLFGSPIQFLWLPPEADKYLDVVYILTLIVFVVDMILNMVVDQDYFGFDPFHRNSVPPYGGAKHCTVAIGSFKMWCDVVSTAAILYDISKINTSLLEEECVELRLDSLGAIVSDSNYYLSILIVEHY